MVRLVREIRGLCETVFHVEHPDHDAHDEFDRTRVNDRFRREDDVCINQKFSHTGDGR